MMNNEWKTGYKEGFADGYAAAKKEMNYQNLGFPYYPPVNTGGAGLNGPVTCDSKRTVGATGSIGATGSYPSTGPFVTGMSIMSDEC